jgi:maltose alpha-D-glucosyltransferase/alpha-amylase
MTGTARQGWIEQVLAALGSQGRRPLTEFLERQRWFGGKGRPMADVRVTDAVPLEQGPDRRLLAIMLVEYRGGSRERYVTPLVIRPAALQGDVATLVELPDSPAHELVCDATHDPETWIRLYDAIMDGRELIGQSGCLSGRSIEREGDKTTEPARKVTVLSGEQSNTSAVLDRRAIMKLLRKVEDGLNPESEVLEFLTTWTTWRDAPPLLGLLTYDDGTGEHPPATVGLLERFVPNSGDGWSYALTRLEELLEEGKTGTTSADHPARTVQTVSGTFQEQLRRLGEITGGMHMALASRMEPEAFRPEPITLRDIEAWESGMIKQLAEVIQDLRALSPERRTTAGLKDDDVTWLETACRHRFDDLRLLAQERVAKIRHHGDYHLGQVLKTIDGFVVIDFEGEPARPLEERRAKVCPLKDVAGMLRSFSYAAHMVLVRRGRISATEAGLLMEWEAAARKTFLDGYRAAARPGQAAFLPAAWEEALRVIRVYELDKALYELRYELRNRPDWLSIPLAGIRAVIGSP